MKPLNLTADFALLDVKGGRRELMAHFEARPHLGPCPPELRVPVTIRGYIDYTWGTDDGISTEFGVSVEEIKILQPGVRGDA